MVIDGVDYLTTDTNYDRHKINSKTSSKHLSYNRIQRALSQSRIGESSLNAMHQSTGQCDWYIDLNDST